MSIGGAGNRERFRKEAFPQIVARAQAEGLSGDWTIGGAGNRDRVRKEAFPQIAARVRNI